MDSQGRPRYVLDQLAERYPIVMHGVSLSIGSTDPLNFDYLARLKRLADAVDARWISDHLCWTGVLGRNTHDLLPLPLNEAKPAARRRADPRSAGRARAPAGVGESQQLRDLCRLDDARMGIHRPHGRRGRLWAAAGREQRLRIEREPQLRSGWNTSAPCRTSGWCSSTWPVTPIAARYRIDTHDGEVIHPVWELYRLAHELTGGASTLLEWDAKIPEFPVVHAEVLKARGNSCTTNCQGETVRRRQCPHPAHGPTHRISSAGAYRGRSRRGVAFNHNKAATVGCACLQSPERSPMSRTRTFTNPTLDASRHHASRRRSRRARLGRSPRELDVLPADVEQVISPSQQQSSHERLEIYAQSLLRPAVGMPAS